MDKSSMKTGWENTKEFADDVAHRSRVALGGASDAISNKIHDCTSKATPAPQAVPVTTTESVPVPVTTTTDVPVTTTTTVPGGEATTGQKVEGFFSHIVDKTREGLTYCSDAISKKFEGPHPQAAVPTPVVVSTPAP